ncbi:MAG: ROK family transcriptional regulator [Gemmatimonadaceae bacterium]|nr:ROK family transcriptional regulator [Gemmatimonadaceae bacterium]
MTDPPMRKLNPANFRLATRATSRDVNRQIALNLIREHQPLSRADLARRMGVRRSVITTLVTDLVDARAVVEQPTTEVRRGRPPTLLSIRTTGELALAIDIRFSRTTLLLCDLEGRPVASQAFDTVHDPAALIARIAREARPLLSGTRRKQCEGAGVIVPGMVDQATGVVLYAPQMGWRDVPLRQPLAAALGVPVQIENAPAACALAKMWLGRSAGADTTDFAYVIVSDGVGVGLVKHGQVVRGATATAGEFGHIPFALDGPLCSCGRHGCWEAYTSNLATVARHLGRPLDDARTRRRRPASERRLTVTDVITFARDGDERAIAALVETGRHLGYGLANIICAINPARIVVGGEITSAWDLLETSMLEAVASRTLTPAAAATPIQPDQTTISPRLLGGVALVAAPRFAMPQVA